MKSKLLFMALGLLLVLFSYSSAQVPQMINYQGKLTTPSGAPVNDTVQMVFTIYEAPPGGSALWTETQSAVIIEKGVFNVLLGSANPIPDSVFDGSIRYLGVAIGGDPEITPRKPMVSVAYAYRAGTAGGGAGGWTDDGSVVRLTTGSDNVGIGTASPTNKLQVDGGTDTAIYATSSGSGTAVWAESEGFAVVGKSTGITYPGVYGENNNGYGVYGSSSNGLGVWGSSLDGYGVWGSSTNGTGVYAISSGGTAVYAQSGGNAVVGISTGSAYAAVYGENNIGYGVYGTSTSGVGVQGYTSGEITGVWGQADGTNGTGVYGVADNGTLSYGVWGISTSGYAGCFTGDVIVTGTLYKGGLAFKIDHPVDPENRYLCHSGVESPDMMNIYNGIVTLDANGEAKVKLSDYFEALNKDFRYQLTCIGDFAPVYIAEKISNNQFKIAGGKANLEVSWQVTGIRHDQFAEAHRIQVEVEKTGAERGKYLHPKEYGVSETLGIDYEKTHEMEEKMKAEPLKTQAEPGKK